MTEPIRQRVPFSVSDSRAMLRRKGAGQDEGHGGNQRAVGAGAPGQVPPDLGPAAMPDGCPDLGPAGRACLGVLVRPCKEIRGRGGNFARAGPQCAVLRILSATGLLSWFEVHATAEGAVTGPGTQRSAVFLTTPSGSRPRGVPVIHGARSRVISEVSMSHGSAVVAGCGPHHGDGAAPAPGWLS